ncbi:MAG: hypothetical protein NTU89_03610, partial [Candidatus Dependentiae bacterium]|nr:hypothetical protein [Candidatus Dependentiae bacterium]
KRNAEISQALQSLGNQMANSTGPERVEAITRFGADFVVPGKIIHAVGGICGAVRSQAKIMRTLEGAAFVLADELGFEEVSQELALATEQLEIVAQENIANNLAYELMEIEANINKPVSISRPAQAIVQDIRNLGGILPYSEVDLCIDLKHMFDHSFPKVNILIDQSTLRQFRQKVYVCEGSSMKVNLDIDHIINFESKLVRNNKLQAFEIQFKGGHLAGICNRLESTGMVKIIEANTLSNGCLEYTLENSFNGAKFTKTEFPAHWDYEKIIKSCWDVFENPISEDILSRDNVHYYRMGIIDNVFEMSIMFKRPTDEICNIVTALPYIKRAV